MYPPQEAREVGAFSIFDYLRRARLNGRRLVAAGVVLVATAGTPLYSHIAQASGNTTDPRAAALAHMGTAQKAIQARINAARKRIQLGSVPHAKLPEPRPSAQGAAKVSHTTAGAGTVVESKVGPAGLGNIQFQNQWFEPKGKNKLVIYAGAQKTPSGKDTASVLVVQQGQQPPRVYRVPSSSGPVHVVSASGERVTLANQAGSQFVFDASTGSFVK